MDTETIKFILTIWGAGLSTLLGILSVLKFSREISIKITVIPTAEPPFDHIRISAVNNSSKAATITHYSISYGTTSNTKIEILKKHLEKEKKLNDSDIWTETIEREELISSFRQLGLQHKPFHRLWTSVYFSNGKVFNDPIHVSPQIIEKEFYEKAEQFIATDLFLGFKQMDSIF